LDGIRDLALREFGLMARTVFHMWGIECTGDFGEIVFNLIEANLMSKTEGDSRADFVGVYDLDQALVHDYRIVLDEVERAHEETCRGATGRGGDAIRRLDRLARLPRRNKEPAGRRVPTPAAHLRPRRDRPGR